MQRITNNLGMKLISLFLAVILWSHVRGEVNPLETASVDVPLKIQTPRDIVLMNENSMPEKVTVLLRGPRLALRNIKGGALANPLAPTEQAPNVISGAVNASLDFSHSRVGEQDVSVKVASNVEDVDVMGVKPSNVTVSLDRAQSLAFPIRVQLSPSLEEGISIVRAKAAPEEVRVFGPSNTLDGIAVVKARINSKTLAPGVPKTLRAHLVAQDRHGNGVRGVHLSPDTVSVSVVLREEKLTRSLPVVARMAGIPASGYEVEKIEVSPSRLRVSGSGSALKGLEQLDAGLELSGASNTIERRISLDLPRGVQTDSGDPARVTVTVRFKRSAAEGAANATDVIEPSKIIKPAGNANAPGSANLDERKPIVSGARGGRGNMPSDELPVRHDAD